MEYYDAQYDELSALEAQTSIVLACSPTQKIMGKPISELVRVKHSKPMLSCTKSKELENARTFIRKAPQKDVRVSWKLDGITVVARY